MKTTLILLALLFAGSLPAFAEPAPEFEQLKTDVETFLTLYETSQLNTRAAKTEYETNLSEQKALQSKISARTEALKELRKSRRKMDKNDRVAKESIEDLLAADPELIEAQKKLSQLNLNVESSKLKYEYLETARKTADQNFNKDMRAFKERETKIKNFVAAKNKVEKDKSKSASSNEEPETLASLLAQSPEQIKRSYQPNKASVAAAPAADAKAPLPVVKAPELLQAEAKTVSENQASASVSTVALPPAGVPVTPAESSPPANPCDLARVELTQLILKNNPDLLSKMVNLAAIKMAYRMTGDKAHLRTLEEYSAKYQAGMNGKFSARLQSFYQTYGRAADQSQINRIFNPKTSYYKPSLRLDNGSASAVLLYLSAKSDSKDKYAITEGDAAAVWAQSQVFSVKKMKIGEAEANQLNFSSQVYRLVGKILPSNGPGLTQAQLEAQIRTQQKEIYTAIENNVNKLKEEQKKACPQTVANCAAEDLKLGGLSLSEVQRHLATAVSKSATDAEKNSAPVKIDFEKTSASNGVIDLKLAQ